MKKYKVTTIVGDGVSKEVLNDRKMAKRLLDVARYGFSKGEGTISVYIKSGKCDEHIISVIHLTKLL